MFDELALIIKTLEDNKDALAGKFLKAKRLALLADLLGPAFHTGKTAPDRSPENVEKIL